MLSEEAEEILLLAVLYELAEGKTGVSVSESSILKRVEELGFTTDEQVEAFRKRTVERFEVVN
jgi:hypothetical protein